PEYTHSDGDWTVEGISGDALWLGFLRIPVQLPMRDLWTEKSRQVMQV
ncbi:hypothetical protein Cadr_000007741, partial [Camelus dromedarius]